MRFLRRTKSLPMTFDGTPLDDRIRALFIAYDVPLEFSAPPGETPSERVARIAHEVGYGERTFEDVVRSVRMLADRRARELGRRSA